MGLTLEGFLTVEQSFDAGDQVFPAFSAVPWQFRLVDCWFGAFAGFKFLPQAGRRRAKAFW